MNIMSFLLIIMKLNNYKKYKHRHRSIKMDNIPHIMKVREKNNDVRFLTLPQ